MPDTTVDDVMLAKIEAFAALVLAERQEEMRRLYSDQQAEWETVQVKPRKLYTLVDVGPRHNMSGKYMIEHATGIIFGIKAYGKVHKGHRYGTIDTVAERTWGLYNGGSRRG